MNTGFRDLGIFEPILRAIDDMGFEQPTEVQYRAIPHILKLKDLIVMSKTGSGKTAVFGTTMLQLTDPDAAGPQGLVLTPTRELAVQVNSDIQELGRHLPHRTTAVYGQHSMSVEITAIKKGAVIVTGTPGRVLDHIRQGNLITKHIRFLVLDEADRMLDMGFIDEVTKIIRSVPRDRVTLLFSATIPPEIQRICRQYMKQPDLIEIESPTKTVDTVSQVYYRVERNEKRTQLNRVLTVEQPDSCMIFCNTKIAVDQVQSYLTRKGYASESIHGDIPQSKRMKTIQQFKQGVFPLLVATDVAARGIHIEGLSMVINYDVPNERDNYVHRIGRTGRVGKEGYAVTFASAEDIMSLYEIEEHINAMIEEAELPTDAEVKDRRESADAWKREKQRPAAPEPQRYEQVMKKKGSRGDSQRQGNPKQEGSRHSGPKKDSSKPAEQVEKHRERAVQRTPNREQRDQRPPQAPQPAPSQPVPKAAAPRSQEKVPAVRQAADAQSPAKNNFLKRTVDKFFRKQS